MSDFQIGDNEKPRIPLHVMQQGGVTPIDAPVFGLGETAPMLLQAASQPIDSGVQAVVQLSRTAQRRGEQRFREYAFEIEREMQQENMDMQREIFEWKKRSWQMEFDAGIKQQTLNNIITMDSLLNQYSQGNPQTMGSRAGASPGSQHFHNPGQVAAANAAEQKAQPAYDALQEWVMGDPAEDPGGMRRYSNEYKKAYATDEYIAAENQRMLYEQEMATWKADPEKYHHELAEHGQQKYLQETDVKVAPDMLYVAPKAIIEEIAEAYSDHYNLPEMGHIGHGFYQAIKVNPGMGEEVVQAMKADTSGTYQALYNMEVEKGRMPPDMDYQTWLDARVRNDLAMYDPTRGYEEIGTPQQQKAVEGGTGAGAFHGEPSGRRSTYGPQLQVRKPTPPAVDRIAGSPGGPVATLDGVDSASGLVREDITGTLGKGDLALVTSRGMLPPPTYKGNNTTGIRVDPDNPTTGTNYIKYLVHAHTGVALNDIDMADYIDADGYLTKAGEEAWRASREKEWMQHTPVIHDYDHSTPRKDRNNKTEYEYYNEIYDPKSANMAESFFFDPYGGNEMLTQAELVEWMGDSDDYNYTGYMDNHNILSLLAEAHNDGTLNPTAFGVEPHVLLATNEQGEHRMFFVPQDTEVLNRPEFVQKAAQHKVFAQAAIGNGSVIPASFDPDEVEGLIGTVLLDQGYGMTQQTYGEMVHDIAGALDGVQLVSDQNGNVNGIKYHLNGKGGRGDGAIHVLNPEFEGLALNVASELRKGLSEGDHFELTQYFDGTSGLPFFGMTINGEEQEILYPLTDQNGMIDREAFSNQLSRTAEFANKPYTELDVRENGMIDGFYGMTPLPVDSTLVPRFHKNFLQEFQKLDQMLVSAGYNYTFTSMWRDSTTSNHGSGRAVDLRYRPETTLDAFFMAINPDFKPSEKGKFNAFEIKGTGLWVARHDNDNGEGTHYHIYMDPNPEYKEVMPGQPVTEGF